MLVNIIVFLFGLIIGSFLNVLIWRLPKGQSIVYPSSHCPKCKHRIAWHDNIPLLSYFILRGKCRHCKAEISGRYPTVEALTGLAFLSVPTLLGFGICNLEFYYLVFFLCSLIVVFFSDLETGLIPDEIIYLGIPVALIYNSLIGNLPSAALGVFLGAALMWGVQKMGELTFKKEALGGGDIKLVAFVGAFLGWHFMLMAVFLGYLIGAAAVSVLLVLKIRKLGDYIPFGPALAAGAAITLYWGNFLLDLYLRTLAA